MATLTITNDDLDEDGLIFQDLLVNINNIRLIDCSWTNISELPWGPNIKSVCCHDCPNITHFPVWPNVKFVDCSYCPSLVALSSWPKIEEVICLNCPQLTLPLWPDVIFRCETEKIERMLKTVNNIPIILLSKKFPTIKTDMYRELQKYTGKKNFDNYFYDVIMKD